MRLWIWGKFTHRILHFCPSKDTANVYFFLNSDPQTGKILFILVTAIFALIAFSHFILTHHDSKKAEYYLFYFLLFESWCLLCFLVPPILFFPCIYVYIHSSFIWSFTCHLPKWSLIFCGSNNIENKPSVFVSSSSSFYYFFAFKITLNTYFINM